MEETWLYHYDSETKQQSVVWRHSGSPRPKKFRAQISAGKVFASIFWDLDGILLIDYLPKGQTINAEYYSALLVQSKDILKEKTPREGHREGLVLARQCPDSHGTCNPEETGLPGLPMSWSPTLFSGSGPVGLPPVPWTEKATERSPFFVRRGGHCCRGDLVGRTTFWIFLSGLQKLEQQAKKHIELSGEYVE